MDSLSNKWYWEKLKSQVQTTMTTPILYDDNKSSLEIHYRIKHKALDSKTLEENMKHRFLAIGLCNDFLDLTSRVKTTKAK